MNTPSPMQRPLPYNVEAEQAVIASVMIDNSAVEKLPFLKPEHFYRETHQWLYETILDLRGDGFPCDPITLTDALENKGLLGKVGGPAAVMKLFLDLPTAIHAVYYGQLVYRDGVKRLGIGKAEKAVRTAYESDDVADFQQALKTAAESVVPIAARHALDNADLGRRILAQLKQTHDTGEAPLLPMALAPLADYLHGWELKKITVLGSLSSTGKSSLAIQEAMYLAEMGYHVVDVSIEIDATARASRYIAHIGQIDETQLIRGFMAGKDVPHAGKDSKFPYRRWSRESVEADTAKAAETFMSLPITIVARDYDGDEPLEPDFSVDGVINTLRAIHATRPIDFIIVDHIHILQYADVSDGYKSNREYGEMVFRFRQLAEQFNAHCLLLHQLDEKARGMLVPDSSGFPGSQRLYHNTDNLIALYNPTVHDKKLQPDKAARAFNVIKARRGITGVVDGIYFDGAISRFYANQSAPVPSPTATVIEQPVTADKWDW